MSLFYKIPHYINPWLVVVLEVVLVVELFVVLLVVDLFVVIGFLVVVVVVFFVVGKSFSLTSLIQSCSVISWSSCV